jgi:hypothetical protein
MKLRFQRNSQHASQQESKVLGTAGWIRTTDLLIHSQYQVIDFSRVCGKSKNGARSPAEVREVPNQVVAVNASPTRLSLKDLREAAQAD